MVKIVVINFTDASQFPSRFTVDVVEPNANPLCYELRSRGTQQYVEFFLATVTGSFTFPSTVIIEGERESFIIALSFEELLEIGGKKLDKDVKKKDRGLKDSADVGFFKLRALSPQNIKDNDNSFRELLKQNEEHNNIQAKSWQTQIDFMRSTFDRREVALRNQIKVLEDSNDKFLQDVLIDTQEWKKKLMAKINQALLAGTRPLQKENKDGE